MGALSLGAIGLSLVSYAATLDEMNEVFDENLKQVALSVAAAHRATREHSEDGKGLTLPIAPGRAEVDPADLVALSWTQDGRLTFSTDPSAVIPFTRQPGPSLTRDGLWHVYTVVQSDGIVQGAQRVSARREMAVESATKMFVPLAGFVVLIGALLVYALRRGLRPLDIAAAHVAARTAVSLEPIAGANVPREIHPLVVAINDMMHRLSVAFDNQRQFVADAAHELRTPITAVRLQSQLVRQAKDDSSRSAALDDLELGIARSEHLVEQLLRLSRVDPSAGVRRVEPVDLAELTRSVVGAMSVQAEQRRIDLGAESRGPLWVAADREQLQIMLNNLVGNAIRYGGEGGGVDVVAEEIDGRPVVRVTDDGPGIPKEERSRVFDRFYRGETIDIETNSTGTGLGLAIVEAVARSHDATVELRTAPSGRGLEVRVWFPAFAH